MFSWQNLSCFAALRYEAAGNMYDRGNGWCKMMIISLPPPSLTLHPFPRGRRTRSSPLTTQPRGAVMRFLAAVAILAESGGPPKADLQGRSILDATRMCYTN